MIRRLAAVLTAAVAATVVASVPRTAPATTYQVYFAGMHNHTGYSDGVPGTTPADAYAKARDLHTLDIMTVTEHSEGFDVPMTLSEQCLDPGIARCTLADGANSVRKWEANLEQAQAATTAGFLALRGFEWTSDTFDHVNVYGSAAYANAKTDGGYATTETFWDWFRDNRDALGTFNHPGDKDVLPEEAGFNQWNDFAHVPDADHRMVGIEVFNGGKSKDYTNRGGVNWIAKALDKGWHVGLVGAQDTHTSDWGSPAYPRTAFLMTALTESAFREAMLARRFYATTDANLRLSFTGDGAPMGSRLRRAAGTSLTLDVAVTDPDPADSVAKIELLTNGGAVAGTVVGSSSASFPVFSGWGESWYLVRVTQADGEKAYSSPIWIGANSHPHGEWLAGDLHVHTQNGHDTCLSADPTRKFDGRPCIEPWTWSFTPGERIREAKGRGLDYLAITDHANIYSQSDPEYLAETALVLVPAYENSLPGHAQMLGARQCYGGIGSSGTPIPYQRCVNPDTSVAGVQAQMAAIRADGGAFQINHPSDGDWLAAYDKDANANGVNDLFEIVPDSIEVWNIGPWVWQPPLPSGNDNDFSISFWERYLRAGKKVAATGGSDSHWRLTSPVQGVGQPTTWVFSGSRDWRAVTAGIRAGYTSVSYNPPSMRGARLFLEADADRNGTFESLAGETVPPFALMRVRVEDAPPGSFVRVVAWDPQVSLETTSIHPVDEALSEAFYQPATYVRAELYAPDGSDVRGDACGSLATTPEAPRHCYTRYAMLALTSAIYQS